MAPLMTCLSTDVFKDLVPSADSALRHGNTVPPPPTNPLVDGANGRVKLPQPRFPIVSRAALHNEAYGGNQAGGQRHEEWGGLLWPVAMVMRHFISS